MQSDWSGFINAVILFLVGLYIGFISPQNLQRRVAAGTIPTWRIPVRRWQRPAGIILIALSFALAVRELIKLF